MPTEGNNTRIKWKFTTKLEDLDFADDIALLSSSLKHMQTKATKLNEYICISDWFEDKYHENWRVKDE